MANFNMGMGGSNRNVLNHGHAGKGSRPRHKLDKNYRANFDEIVFGPSEGFEKREGKLTKRYGPAKEPKLEVQIFVRGLK